MKERSLKSVGDILAKLVKKTGLGKQIDQARIWECWEDLAGANLHTHGRPRSIKDNTLIVEVDSPVWMNKYAYFKWDILQRVNRLAGKELVSDLFLVLSEDETPEIGSGTK